jgi:DHA1 family bicyclomycin/chloramphenicol resistance-like MFS transporter
MFVVGRFIQGFGIGGPRIVSQAICRDLFSGNKLASINSFIMSIFILVPVIAPLIGQSILFFFYWKFIIFFFILFSLATTSFLIINVDETLKDAKKINIINIIKHFKEVLSNVNAMIYIACLGLLLGGLLTFINICQPLYYNYFDVGTNFPLFFALIASMLGLSSYLNSKYVWQFGAGKLALVFSLILMIWTLIHFTYQINYLSLNLVWFSIYIMISFSFFGFIFGNLNALAINPFGHIAGYASSIIGALSTFVALVVSGSSATYFDGTPDVVVFTLSICSILTFALLFFQKRFLMT